MVGDDVLGQLEPEDRQAGEDGSLAWDRRRVDDVVGRDPVGGDHQDLLAELVHLADLAGRDQGQVGDRTHARDSKGCPSGIPLLDSRRDGQAGGIAVVGAFVLAASTGVALARGLPGDPSSAGGGSIAVKTSHRHISRHGHYTVTVSGQLPAEGVVYLL